MENLCLVSVTKLDGQRPWKHPREGVVLVEQPGRLLLRSKGGLKYKKSY